MMRLLLLSIVSRIKISAMMQVGALSCLNVSVSLTIRVIELLLDCPKTCGLCDSGTCTDIFSGCNTMTSLCKNVEWQTYVSQNFNY